MIPEEELSAFLRKVDDVRGELELEKARIDSFVVGKFLLRFRAFEFRLTILRCSRPT